MECTNTLRPEDRLPETDKTDLEIQHLNQDLQLKEKTIEQLNTRIRELEVALHRISHLVGCG